MDKELIKGVLKYINVIMCKVVGGRWIKFIINFIEKSEGVLDSCIDKLVYLVRGLLYELYLLLQGVDRKSQYVVVQEFFEVIYVFFIVVNYNGVNMEGKFLLYKWKVFCFFINII